MILPRLLVLTDRTLGSGSLVDTVAVAVDHGARAVVLREKDLPSPERADLAAALRALLDPVGGLLIMAGAPGSGSAVHLAAADPFPSPRPSLVGRSCHRESDLVRAGEEACDYVTISPVFLTPSKPGYGPALGPAGLASRMASARSSVFALGGVTPERVAPCLAAGAYGVAVMGAIMGAPSLTAAYLSTLEDQ